MGIGDCSRKGKTLVILMVLKKELLPEKESQHRGLEIILKHSKRVLCHGIRALLQLRRGHVYNVESNSCLRNIKTKGSSVLLIVHMSLIVVNGIINGRVV